MVEVTAPISKLDITAAPKLAAPLAKSAPSILAVALVISPPAFIVVETSSRYHWSKLNAELSLPI